MCWSLPWEYSHSVGDAQVQEVGVTNGIDGGNNDLLHFGVLVSQVDILDEIVPLNPAAFSIKLFKRLEI